MAVFISLAAGAININAMNRGSALAIGEVAQPGWNQNGKTNFGNSQLFGANLQTGIVTNFIDNDVLDAPVLEIQPVPTFQNQSI